MYHRFGLFAQCAMGTGGSHSSTFRAGVRAVPSPASCAPHDHGTGIRISASPGFSVQVSDPPASPPVHQPWDTKFFKFFQEFIFWDAAALRPPRSMWDASFKRQERARPRPTRAAVFDAQPSDYRRLLDTALERSDLRRLNAPSPLNRGEGRSPAQRAAAAAAAASPLHMGAGYAPGTKALESFREEVVQERHQVKEYSCDAPGRLHESGSAVPARSRRSLPTTSAASDEEGMSSSSGEGTRRSGIEDAHLVEHGRRAGTTEGRPDGELTRAGEDTTVKPTRPDMEPHIRGSMLSTKALATRRKGLYASIIEGGPSSAVTDTWLASFATLEEWLPPPIFYLLLMCLAGELALLWLVFGFDGVPELDPSGHVTMMGLLAFLLGFRINQAYDRWWEGRTLWGEVIFSSRNLASNAASVFTDIDRLKRLVLHITVFAWALRSSLRGQKLGDDEKDVRALELEHWTGATEIKLWTGVKLLPPRFHEAAARALCVQVLVMDGLLPGEEIDWINSFDHVPLAMVDQMRIEIKHEISAQMRANHGAIEGHVRRRCRAAAVLRPQAVLRPCCDRAAWHTHSWTAPTHPFRCPQWDLIIGDDIRALLQAMTGCERINSTPMPFNYLTILRMCMTRNEDQPWGLMMPPLGSPPPRPHP